MTARYSAPLLEDSDVVHEMRDRSVLYAAAFDLMPLRDAYAEITARRAPRPPLEWSGVKLNGEWQRRP